MRHHQNNNHWSVAPGRQPWIRTSALSQPHILFGRELAAAVVVGRPTTYPMLRSPAIFAGVVIGTWKLVPYPSPTIMVSQSLLEMISLRGTTMSCGGGGGTTALPVIPPRWRETPRVVLALALSCHTRSRHPPMSHRRGGQAETKKYHTPLASLLAPPLPRRGNATQRNRWLQLGIREVTWLRFLLRTPAW